MAKIIGIDDIMSDNNKFKPGDFIRFSNKEGSFAIYEGVDMSTSKSYKKLTALLSYDPSKYMNTSEGYKTIPYLEMTTKNKQCEKTIDTDENCYWTRKCNAEEKEAALEILREYGLMWDEKTLSILDETSGKVLASVKIPSLEYKGQIIKPMTDKFKKLLRLFCLEKNKKVDYSRYSYEYNRYWDMYGEGYEDFWD